MNYIHNLSAIVAMDTQKGIGLNNKLPWHYKKDLLWFKQKTINKKIIMGRNTFQSILQQNNNELLSQRQHIVLSKQDIQHPNVIFFNKFFDIINEVQENPSQEYVLIGGAQLYNTALPLVNNLYLTKIKKQYPCDTFIDIDKYPFHAAKTYYDYTEDDLNFTVYKRS